VSGGLGRRIRDRAALRAAGRFETARPLPSPPPPNVCRSPQARCGAPAILRRDFEAFRAEHVDSQDANATVSFVRSGIAQAGRDRLSWPRAGAGQGTPFRRRRAQALPQAASRKVAPAPGLSTVHPDPGKRSNGDRDRTVSDV